MIGRIAIAVCYGLAAVILVYFLALLIDIANVHGLDPIARFLKEWAWAIGVIVGVLAFFGNARLPGRPAA